MWPWKKIEVAWRILPTFNNGVAYVQMIVVFISANFRHQNRQIMIASTFDTYAEGAIWRSSQFDTSQLKIKMMLFFIFDWKYLRNIDVNFCKGSHSLKQGGSKGHCHIFQYHLLQLVSKCTYLVRLNALYGSRSVETFVCYTNRKIYRSEQRLRCSKSKKYLVFGGADKEGLNVHWKFSLMKQYFFLSLHSAQWSDRVTKPFRSFSNIETFLDILNAFGYKKIIYPY